MVLEGECCTACGVLTKCHSGSLCQDFTLILALLTWKRSCRQNSNVIGKSEANLFGAAHTLCSIKKHPLRLFVISLLNCGQFL